MQHMCLSVGAHVGCEVCFVQVADFLVVALHELLQLAGGQLLLQRGYLRCRRRCRTCRLLQRCCRPMLVGGHLRSERR